MQARAEAPDRPVLLQLAESLEETSAIERDYEAQAIYLEGQLLGERGRFVNEIE